MLTGLTSTLMPALSIMQSIVSDQVKGVRSLFGDQVEAGATVGVTPSNDTAKTQKLNDYYFGDHMTVTEVMVKLFTHLGDYLADRIDARTSLEAAAPDQATLPVVSATERSIATMDKDVRSDLSARLRDFDGASASATELAFRIARNFDLDALGRDRKLSAFLEQRIGIDLGSINAGDLVRAFMDPDGDAARKLRGQIGEALAGQAGSKVMQRLEDAASGVKSVEETKAEARSKDAWDEVDEETKQEDVDDVKTAKALETLSGLSDAIDEASDAIKEAEAEARRVAAEIGAIRDKGVDGDEPEVDDPEGPSPSPYAASDRDDEADDRSGQASTPLYL